MAATPGASGRWGRNGSGRNSLTEPIEGAPDAFLIARPGFPARKDMPRRRQVRTPICRILGSRRVVLDAAAGDKRPDEFRDAQDGNLVIV
ncbi:hypothetical protein, partial [Mesorhizobium sp. M7A.F.Ca.CA.001.14.1.1]|uniref:hypothetical protein n=1 Tax=Mesorhizobium sp. M7A.F.Ca.CA.001.14.1.1 TaxID=2496706 RepID=UPI0019D4B46D